MAVGLRRALSDQCALPDFSPAVFDQALSDFADDNAGLAELQNSLTRVPVI